MLLWAHTSSQFKQHVDRFSHFRPLRSTTYVDATYCYTDRAAWSVGLSVCRFVCMTSVAVVSPAKTAEPIEMSFGISTRVSPTKHVLAEVYSGATWRIPLNRPCAAAMRPVVKFL